MRKFKYRASFSSYIRGINVIKGKKEAKAALDNLKSIIPADVMDNEALLPICFNACVINRANKNGDIMGTDTGLSIYQKFNHSQVNAEHNRDNIIGHVVGTALSSFDENYAIGAGSEILDPMTLAGGKDPFNIALSAVIYKVLGTNLEDMITNASDPSSPNYLGVSASWEVGFDDFVLAVGSQNLADCQIITDPTAIQAYSKYLSCLGGTGRMDDGQYVFRMITGDVLPLGIGLTFSPAAPVAGIVIPTADDIAAPKDKVDPVTGQPIKADDDAEADDDPDNEQGKDPVVPKTITLPITPQPDETEDPDVFPLASAASALEKVTAKGGQVIGEAIANISKNAKTNVTPVETPILNNDMTFKSLDEALASLKTDDATAAFTGPELKALLEAEIKKANDIFKGELTQVEADKATLLESKTAVELERTNLTTKVEELTSQLAALTEAQQQAEAAVKFDERMASLDSQYNLTDKQREIIAKAINGLDDESFNTYLENKAAFLVVKTAEPAAEVVVDAPVAKEAIASVVAAIVPKAEPIPNGLSTEPSWRQKLADSFSETEILSVNRRK